MVEPFIRERVRHELRVRRVVVSAVRRVTPTIARVTFGGGELAGFTAAGPADHVKVFFPDPATGALAAPTITPDGIRRPDSGVVISRDYTPLAFRDGPQELDIDFVLHGAEGPASAWAAAAAPGDELAIAGPRGSQLAPLDLSSALIVADETALPAASRWLTALAGVVPVIGLFSAADEAASGYFDDADAAATATLAATWITGPDRDARLTEALRGAPVDDGTFVFLAGEATAMVPLRRYLRRERALPKGQVDAHGYWKRGVVALDHHAPLDASDPD